MDKIKIRKKFISLRKKKNVFNYEIKIDVLNNLKKKIDFKNKTIAGYFPINHEISILNLLQDLKKRNNKIVFPKIKNSSMSFYRWERINFLSINNLGIPEPNTSKKKENPDIMFIPLVAFDKYKNRLGYGGGFYDRYLKNVKNKKKIVKIGCAFSFQKINKLPAELHDEKLDLIITEKKIIL